MNEPFKLGHPVLVVWHWKGDLFLYIEKDLNQQRVDYGTCWYDSMNDCAYGDWKVEGSAESLKEAREKLQAFAAL
jgi:hypothetical protein